MWYLSKTTINLLSFELGIYIHVWFVKMENLEESAPSIVPFGFKLDKLPGDAVTK